MSSDLPVAALVVAVTFAATGLRRLADPFAARRDLAALGLSARAVAPVVSGLTLGELAVTAGLLTDAGTTWTAVLALICLAVPAGAAVTQLAREDAKPAAVSAVVRANLVGVTAGVVWWLGRSGDGADLWSWLAGLAAGQLLAVAAGAALVALLAGGFRLPAIPRFGPAAQLPATRQSTPAASVPAAQQSGPAAQLQTGARLPTGAQLPTGARPTLVTPQPPTEPATAEEPATTGEPATADTPPPARRGPALIRPGPELTIGMATYDDFDGVYFTLQALRLYQNLDNVELLVVDNFGCDHTRDFVRDWAGGTYVRATDSVGTAVAKDLVFRRASGAAVLCCDSHVLFMPGVIARLKQWHRDHPDSADLLQGPLVYDDGTQLSSHFEPVWREQMWGIWATDPRALDPDGEPFEIPMQGLGAFSCRADAWPGFHPGFRGFGGEEGYLHEKFRQAGHRCVCLPWLRWMHRFGRPRGTPYPLTVEDKLRNYVLGHAELGLDLAPVLQHFAAFLPAERVAALADQTLREPRDGRV